MWRCGGGGAYLNIRRVSPDNDSANDNGDNLQTVPWTNDQTHHQHARKSTQLDMRILKDGNGRKKNGAIAGVALAALSSLAFLSRNWGGKSKCAISFGSYNGPRYSKKGETLSSTCLVESKWMQLSQHTVSIGAGKAMQSINDWLFIDYHDRINVLVEVWGGAAAGTGDDQRQSKERRFVVFKQTKYAYSGESLAVIGGIIEPDEDPEDAARREVVEEMRVHCGRLVSLGKYRTDVNRGMGWVHSFIASECNEITKEQGPNDLEETNQIGAADVEGQERIYLTVGELRDAARNGEFVEVQWSNTVALALLNIDDT